MARLFNDATPDFLQIDSAVLTAVPLTMACWFNSDDATSNQTLMYIGNSSENVQFFAIAAAGGIAGDPVRLFASDSATTTVDTTTGYSVNTWHHACGVFSSATSRTVYIDGGSSATSTVSRTPTGLNRTAIGQRRTLTPTQAMSGLIAEAAIWNVALTAADVAVLADGFSPLFVRPDALQAYWPLVGRYSPEISVSKGGFDLTVTGAVAGDHVRQIWKRRRTIGSRLAAAGPSAGLRTLALTGVGI